MHNESRTASRARDALRLPLSLVACLAIVAGLASIGLVAAIDSGLQRAYYKARGTVEGAKNSASPVLLVALDDTTAKRWGAPPWPDEHFQSLVAKIMESEENQPKVVALLEGSMLLMRDSAADALEEKGWLVPKSNDSSPGGFAQPALRIDHGGVDEITLKHPDGTPSVLSRVVEKIAEDAEDAEQDAGLGMPATATLPIHYTGSPDSLPTIAAHRIVDGQISNATFAGRIVIIGPQGQWFAPRLPTPVGPMSPAEIQAHALTGWLAGKVWRAIPWWQYWLMLAGFALVLLVVAPRVRTGVVIAIAAISLATAIGLDYWLFVSGTTMLGASGFALVLIVALLGSWISERRRARREMGELSRWLAKQAETELQSGSLRGSDEDFLRKFLRASRTYVDFHSAIFAELPQGKFHLADDSFLCLDTETSEIFERRRDVRRDPYAKAYRTHRPEWATRPFMKKELELKTLMVPLVELGRILGYWVVNFPRATKISRRKIQLIETLGHQASIALDRRRLQQKVREKDGALASSKPTVLLGQLRDTRQAAASMLQSQHRIDELFENLPVGVLVATLWGEVELVNAVMRRFLHEMGIEDPLRMSLPALVAKISGSDEDRVREQLRNTMGDKSAVRISRKGGASEARSRPRQLVLSRVSGSSSEDAALSSRAAHFVLIANEQSAMTAVDAPHRADTSSPSARATHSDKQTDKGPEHSWLPTPLHGDSQRTNNGSGPVSSNGHAELDDDTSSDELLLSDMMSSRRVAGK